MLHEEIGRGNSGTVYLAEHIKLKAPRAIKCVNKKHFMYEQFLMEARLLKNLKHPGIPIIYDLEEDDNFLYIIEEYIEGESLQALVLNHIKFSQRDIIQIGIQICSILEYLHSIKPSPVIYLDLKPMHIIVYEKQVKLIDFGTAIMMRDAKRMEYSMGTPGFAAPEQYGQVSVNQKTDIFAIGAVLRFMEENSRVDNNADFQGESKCYEEKIKKIIQICMLKDPDKRYQGVSDLKGKLQQILKTTGTACKTTSSLVFAIVGSQPRIGATHIAISLVSYLNRKQYDCIYKEKNFSNMMHLLKENQELVKEKEGIYLYENFAGIPNYGQGVSCSEEHSIIVEDYGSGNVEQKGLQEADIIIAVLGTKPWEMKYSKELAANLAPKSNVCFVLNFAPDTSLIKVGRTLKLKKLYKMPYFPDPFTNDKVAGQLFCQLIKNHLLITKGGVLDKPNKTHNQNRSIKNHRSYWMRAGSWCHSFIHYVRKLPWF